MGRPVAILTVIMFSYAGPSVQATEKASPVFEKDVQPILKANCLRCHNSKRKRADLDLSSAAGILKGSESGPVIVPNEPKKSLLYEKVQKGEMPPGNSKLSEKEIAAIKSWIDAGAKTLQTEDRPEVTQLDIEPLMQLRCGACHGLRKKEGGLDLRTKASMLKGGKSGPVIVLGKPNASLILKRIHAAEMPPRKRLLEVSVKPMAQDEVERLSKWIELGAPEVERSVDVATSSPDPLVSEKDRSFWSFQAPKRVAVPTVSSNRVRNPIDAFVFRQLKANQLDFSPEADRLTLIRRACFDLIGMPPSSQQVKQFVNDPAPDAYERMIDALLASPHYGERWGRYWLDLAGYADSEGKRSADPIRPHAWRYRDYVIRAFNSDKPYDRFLQEQIAGDELVDYQNADKITDDMIDCLIATGFLRMTPDGTGSNVVNFVPNRLEVIADEIQVLGSSVMGLTLHCARCHSHKYDPIPQRDYYRLLAVFKGAYDEHDWMVPTVVKGQGRSERPSRVLHSMSDAEKRRWQDYIADVKQEIARLKKVKQTREVTRRIRSLETIAKSKPAIRALWDRGEPSPTYIYRRGDHLQPSRLVGPGVPSVLTDGKTPFVVESPFPGVKQTGRRLAFARWLTESDHPLTSRVIVNRIWKHHFGTGIVKTLDNFGKTGAKPTHPELLDWLAREFVRRGWSIKAMHRLMMTSTTYRQGSTVESIHKERDPDNRWLSRMPLKRLEAEAIYDALLFVSGKFDQQQFGPPDTVKVRKDGLVTPAGSRRSIYVRQRRSQIPTLLDTFDLPQMNPNCVARINSNVAPQALFLKNNAWIDDLANAFARRVKKQAGNDAVAQVKAVYWTALSRAPSTEELKVSTKALSRLTDRWVKDTSTTAGNRELAAERALETFCHAIMNSAEFIYVD